jgi:hypothetical protein
MILLDRAFPRRSFLDNVAVRAPTLRFYPLRIRLFTESCSSRRVQSTTDIGLDSALVEYLDDVFFRGMSADDGSKIIAGLKYFLPSPSRIGPAAPPSAVRAPTAWQKTAPTAERLPLPLVCYAAIVVTIIYSGDLDIDRRCWLQLATYLRPGEVDNLKVESIVLPLRAAGLRYRHSVIFATSTRRPTRQDGPPRRSNLTGSVSRARGRPRSAYDRTASHAAVLESHRFRDPPGPCRDSRALALDGPQAHTPQPPSRRCLRGPSRAQAQSRWNHAAKPRRQRHVTRYTKKSRLTSELVKLDPRVIKYVRKIQQDISAFLLGVMRPHPPPLVPSLARARSPQSRLLAHRLC